MSFFLGAHRWRPLPSVFVGGVGFVGFLGLGFGELGLGFEVFGVRFRVTSRARDPSNIGCLGPT